VKISLISPYPDITSFGVRTLSAYMRQHSHSTRLIFLPDPHADNPVHGQPRYNDSVLDQAVDLCSESDLIGIALMTNFFDAAVQITEKLKKRLDVPVIWGGVHPTIRPEECLEYADMVCVGEGEDALLELVEKMSGDEDHTKTRNIWCKVDRELIKNPLRPLPDNLDAYPYPDYSMIDHFIMVEDTIEPLTHAITESILGGGTVSDYVGKIGYQTMTSRGCPYNCAYCINDTIRQMYAGQPKLRWRSVANVVGELTAVKESMPYINYVWISDDEFMARKTDSLKDFCREYKENVDLPFSCLVSPLSVTEQKMELLLDAGLVYVQMGIESGSARMQEIYNRKHMNNERMMNAVRIINRYSDRMHAPSYDFLIDAPFETDKDRIESLRFIGAMPKPFRIQPFTLIPYPGTHMYEMVKEKGLIKDDRREIYNKTYIMRKPTYLSLVLVLAKGGKCPASLLNFLVSSPAVNILNSRLFRPVFKLLYLSLRSVHYLMKRVLPRK
jgi:anaerobic magnesium-protoporphyrin IX monomethyl ester cyclase